MRAGSLQVGGPGLSGAGAQPEGAKGEHWGHHRLAGDIGEGTPKAA